MQTVPTDHMPYAEQCRKKMDDPRPITELSVDARQSLVNSRDSEPPHPARPNPGACAPWDSIHRPSITGLPIFPLWTSTQAYESSSRQLRQYEVATACTTWSLRCRRFAPTQGDVPSVHDALSPNRRSEPCAEPSWRPALGSTRRSGARRASVRAPSSCRPLHGEVQPDLSRSPHTPSRDVPRVKHGLLEPLR